MEFNILYNRLTELGKCLSELNYHIRGIPAFGNTRSFKLIADQLNINPESFIAYRILCLEKEKEVNFDKLHESNQSWSLSPIGCKRMVLNSYSKREKMIIYKAIIKGYSLNNLVLNAIKTFEEFYANLPLLFIEESSDLKEVIEFKNHLQSFKDKENSLLNTEDEIIAVDVKEVTVYENLTELDF